MTPAEFYTALDATWPAAFVHRAGPWQVREGQGGGQRVSATTAVGDWQSEDIALAEAAMEALGQKPIFMIRNGDTDLDLALNAEGYRIHDPVTAYAGAVNALPNDPAHMTTFPHWPPLAIARDLWAEAGIGPGRLAVMARAKGPKTAILSRLNDRAAGIAFVACHGTDAMLHALEVTPAQRRQGSANNILRAAVNWAQSQGATRLSLAVTTANENARRLYTSFGMEVVGHYHYRIK